MLYAVQYLHIYATFIVSNLHQTHKPQRISNKQEIDKNHYLYLAKTR